MRKYLLTSIFTLGMLGVSPAFACQHDCNGDPSETAGSATYGTNARGSYSQVSGLTGRSLFHSLIDVIGGRWSWLAGPPTINNQAVSTSTARSWGAIDPQSIGANYPDRWSGELDHEASTNAPARDTWSRFGGVF